MQMKQAEDYAQESVTQRMRENDDMEEDQLSQASDTMLADTRQTDPEESQDANLGIILKELREFRKDSSHRCLTDICEDINKIYKRVEVTEERIDASETRIQSSEEVLAELVKLQTQTEDKLMDLEGRSWQENVRLYGVKEGAEEGTATMTTFVEDLLIKGLELPSSTALNIERAHRALTTKPPTKPHQDPSWSNSRALKWKKRYSKKRGKERDWTSKGRPWLRTGAAEEEEGLHRGEGCAEGKKHKISDPVPSQAAVVLQGGHGDLQLGRGSNGRHGSEGDTGDGSEKPDLSFGSDQPAVLATQRKARKPDEPERQTQLQRFRRQETW